MSTVKLYHSRYNEDLWQICRDLDGKVTVNKKTRNNSHYEWVFPAYVQDKVIELNKLYNEDLVIIEIKCKYNIFQAGNISFLGYSLIKLLKNLHLCKGDIECEYKESAKVGKGVSLIGGCYSVAWDTGIANACLEEASFRTRISKKLLEESEYLYTDEFEVTILQGV